MRFAYADPPYPGQARKHYAREELCAEVDHEALFAELGTFDAWALSTSTPALRDLLPMAPAGSRVGAWVKGWCSFKPGINPAYAWEPVIFHTPERSPPPRGLVRRDWLSAPASTGRALHGAKPEAFSFWIFCLLGAQVGDQFADLFPGTGGVTDAWERWERQGSLFRERPDLLIV